MLYRIIRCSRDSRSRAASRARVARLSELGCLIGSSLAGFGGLAGSSERAREKGHAQDCTPRPFASSPVDRFGHTATITNSPQPGNTRLRRVPSWVVASGWRTDTLGLDHSASDDDANLVVFDTRTANAGGFSLQPRLLPAGVLRRVCERLASPRAPRRGRFGSDLRRSIASGCDPPGKRPGAHR